jgi:hypothetical protein
VAAHKFKVGQLVTLHSKRGAFAEQFEVVRLLPAANADFQYRVKSTRDGHERSWLRASFENAHAVIRRAGTT